MTGVQTCALPIFEWLYNIYQIINKSFAFELWHIFYGIAAVAVFIWSYGYKSDEKITGIKKILHIITYILAAAVVIQAILFATAAFGVIF